MADLPTRLDLYAIGREYVLARAKRLDPAQVDVAGSDANVYIGSNSVMAFAMVKHLAQKVATVFLDSCEGEDLDRYAMDRYRLPRKGAAAAVGEVRIYRITGAVGGTVTAGTRLRTLTGNEYITLTSATFAPGALSVTGVKVRAQQAGKSTQVGKNQIRAFAQPEALFDPNLLINNDEATSGGEPAEDDDTFKSRIRDFWRTARRGILAAIEFGAKTVAGVVSAVALEALSVGEQPARVVNLYIADSSGVASRSLGDLVKTALNAYRAGGIAVIIYTSIPQFVDIRLRLRFVANIDTISVSEVVRAAVVEFVNSLPVNGTLRVGDLFSLVRRYAANGVIAGDDLVIAPVGDLYPSTGQTLRTTLERVTIE